MSVRSIRVRLGTALVDLGLAVLPADHSTGCFYLCDFDDYEGYDDPLNWGEQPK